MDERNRDYRARSSNDKKSQRDVLYPPRSSLPLPPQPASSSSSHYPRREYSEKEYNSTRANRDYDKNHKGYYDGRYDTYERYDRYDKSERYDNVNINTNKHEKSTRYAGYDEHYKYDNYKDYDDYASPTSWNTGSNSTNRVSRTENTHRYSLRSSSGFDSSHQYTKYTDSTAKSYYHSKSQKPPSRPYHKRFDDYDNNDNSNDRNNHNDINNDNNGYYGQSSSDRYAKVDGYSGEYSSSNRYNDSGSSYKNTTRYEGYESRMKKKHGKYYDYYNERDRKDTDTNIVSNSNYNSNSTFTSDAAAAFDKWGKVDEIDNYTNVNENESENDSKGFNYNTKEQQKRQGNLSVEYIPNYNNYSVVKQPEDKKYLLVLDLNGTLVHRSKKSKRITKRPYLDEFLSFALQNFAVMVWSSAQPMNVAKMVRSIFNENQQQIEQLAAIWDRRYCHFIRPKSTTPITNYSPYDTSPIDSDTQSVTPSVVDFNLDDVIPATLENEGLLFGQYFMKSKTIKDLESIWNGFDLSQSAFKSLYKNTHYYYSHPQDDNLNFTTTRIPSSNSNSNGKREWNSKWNSSNTLLLDDSPGKASKQPNNHLCVSTFDNVYQDSDDTLLRVIDYLTEFLRNGGGKNSTKNQESDGSGTKISPSNISEYIYSFPFSQ
ncbi:putative FCP1-like protein [Zancudomyces culisetae]|uniref:Putative FCP1-like protein n=1 Tax=Zancudomyces culisetae TaxID=1213189 RepID=A0A1R1PCC5_ZANCU|nr:putative FCP1-like protein [Zancudomyces culisetae]|eukprot:OMH78569.1 putative FCP1-like protein [Zancudomyces culisetae]